MKTPSQIIEDAHELLSDESKWTRAAYARKSDDAPTLPSDTAACKWCLAGALMRAGNGQPVSYDKAYGIVEEVIGGGNRGVADFNDDPATTHADVLNALNVASGRA